MTTEIRFMARIGKTAISPAKDGYGTEPGAFEVTLRVQQPKLSAREPSATQYVYYGNNQGKNTRIDVAPDPVEKRKGEHADAFTKRQALCQKLLEAHQGYVEQRDTYERDLRELAPRSLIWAQLVGLSALFGGKEVLVTLSPTEAQLLPGFTLDALMPPIAIPVDDAEVSADDVPWEDADQEEPRCRNCGCTEEGACRGGCVWVPDPEGMGELCSACLPAVEAALIRRDPPGVPIDAEPEPATA